MLSTKSFNNRVRSFVPSLSVARESSDDTNESFTDIVDVAADELEEKDDATNGVGKPKAIVVSDAFVYQHDPLSSRTTRQAVEPRHMIIVMVVVVAMVAMVFGQTLFVR